jgi:hypothetical protein
MSEMIRSPQTLCAKRRLPKRKKLRHKLRDYLGPRTELRDRKERNRPISSRFSKTILGDQADAAPRQIAIYAHYNPHSRITEMVLKQLEVIREAGFEIMLVSMSPIESEEDQEAVRPLVHSIVVRKSFGRDFGAWHDIIQSHPHLMSVAEEILLINDSLLGPFGPLAPLIDSMRQSGEGLFGLTDSPDQEPHLQSYFLLFRGQAAINTLLNFMSELRLSFHKRTMIQRGELGLARYFASKNIPMRALYPFDKVEEKALQVNMYMEALLACYPGLVETGESAQLPTLGKAFDIPRYNRMRIQFNLLGLALNPTHYYWRVLIREFGFPFIKTNLITENEARIPDIADWPEVIPHGGPVGRLVVERHLGIK